MKAEQTGYQESDQQHQFGAVRPFIEDPVEEGSKDKLRVAVH
jgi:hypothetical protein